MNFLFQSMRASGVTLLWLGILLTGVGIAYTTHEARQLQNDLQGLLKQKDALRNEWTQLLLEQSAWATDSRVDSMARTTLSMAPPASSTIVVIEP